jgi:hypothetical protein
VSDERTERVGRNEALFRVVNERLEDLNRGFTTVTDTFEIVCECGRADCLEHIVISPTAYEDLRTDPALFAVVPGHELEDVEQVVASHEGYNVIRKDPGRPEEIAEATDPRS